MGELYNSIYILSSFTLNRIFHHRMYVCMFVQEQGYKWENWPLLYVILALSVHLHYIYGCGDEIINFLGSIAKSKIHTFIISLI